MKERKKPLILISSCILGNKVRFNGGHTQQDWIVDVLGKYVDFYPICPEMAMGMGTPREQIHVAYKKDGTPTLVGRSGRDYRNEMNEVKEKYLKELLDMDFDGIIMQGKSPSCGIERIKHRNQDTGIPDKAEAGVFGQFFMDHLPLTPIFDSGRLHNWEQRHIFLSQLFANFTFKQQVKSRADLQNFHKSYKYFLMGYNQDKMREMGRLAANDGDHKAYLGNLLELLSKRICKKNMVNSFYHILGYLKKDLERNEKEFIHQLIDDYANQKSYENKAEPVIKFLVEKYDIKYLKEQKIFEPYPRELADIS
jgi:uncharacterized protein YbbK (DUF523 family)/uncharacterized protein YbgA (DUF1722 family)